jgi:hypothetical protein
MASSVGVQYSHAHPELNNKQNRVGVYLLPLCHLRGRRGLWFFVHGCVASFPAAVAFFAALTLCASLAHSSLSRNLRSVRRGFSQYK